MKIFVLEVRNIPLSKGQICSKATVGPFIKYWPIPNSKAIKGIPQITSESTYGIKKAPIEHKQEKQ